MECGLLQIAGLKSIPTGGPVADSIEQPIMIELHQTYVLDAQPSPPIRALTSLSALRYGKTIHSKCPPFPDLSLTQY